MTQRKLEPPDGIAPEPTDPISEAAERAKAYVSKNFGKSEEPAQLCDAIWSIIRRDEARAFNLSDIDEICASANCDDGLALAVLTLLSRPEARLLKLEMISEAGDGAEVPMGQFIAMLSAWHRDKSISDEDWERWASEIKVRWVLNRQTL